MHGADMSKDTGRPFRRLVRPTIVLCVCAASAAHVRQSAHACSWWRAGTPRADRAATPSTQAQYIGVFSAPNNTGTSGSVGAPQRWERGRGLVFFLIGLRLLWCTVVPAVAALSSTASPAPSSV